MKIITASGLAQHGKDASLSIAKHHFEKLGKKCLVVANGDYLKFVCQKYFGWDGVKDNAGRTLLQVKGTEEARDRYPDVWVDVVIALLRAFGRDYDYVLIPDVRYPNEIRKLKKSGFEVFTFWVYRKNFDNGLSPEQKAHRSETSMLDFPFDFIISVESGVDHLKTAVENMIKEKSL